MFQKISFKANGIMYFHFTKVVKIILNLMTLTFERHKTILIQIITNQHVTKFYVLCWYLFRLFFMKYYWKCLYC